MHTASHTHAYPTTPTLATLSASATPHTPRSTHTAPQTHARTNTRTLYVRGSIIARSCREDTPSPPRCVQSEPPVGGLGLEERQRHVPILQRPLRKVCERVKKAAGAV